jgi:hypothetical protein
MSDSLSSADRDARIAEIEEMLADVMYERRDLEKDAKWLIAELRAALSREEEAKKDAEPSEHADEVEWEVREGTSVEVTLATRDTADWYLNFWRGREPNGDWHLVKAVTARTRVPDSRSVSLSENG